MDFNIAASEWSNGCESGWTGYFDESYITRNDNVGYSQSYRLNSTPNDDDEDLSMVSDASSGPPHASVQEEEDDDQQSYSRSIISRNNGNCCYSTNSEKSSKKSTKKSKKSSIKEHKKVMSCNNNNNKHQNHQQYHLDDTASSPAVSPHYQKYASPSNINMNFSQNFSATQCEGNSSYSNHYAFWQSSHVQETDYSAQPGQLSGRRWE